MPSVKSATFKINHATNSFELQDFICELLCEFANFLQIFSIDNLKMLIYLPRFDLEISKLKKPILVLTESDLREYSISRRPNIQYLRY